MTTVAGASARETMLRNSTQILKSILTDTPPFEPGSIPILTSSAFAENQSFVANISRLVMDLRASKEGAVARPPASAAGTAAGRTMTVDRAEIGKVYGTAGADKLTLSGSRIDYVSAGAGDDTITAKATGLASAKPGLTALDSGSVTRIYGGAGNDRIQVEAEQLADTIYGGDGDDTMEVTASYASEIAGGEGNDKVTVNAYVVENVDGNGGDDDITVTARVDRSLDQILKDTTRSGSVTNITSGFGDDRITVHADESIDMIDAGRGNDTIVATARYFLAHVAAGSGDDRVTLKSDQYIRDVDLGSGNDALEIDGKFIQNIAGGYGSDRILITGDLVSNVDGGSGDDTITIMTDLPGGLLSAVDGVSGGAGNDSIMITSRHIGTVQGGRGDDDIVLRDLGDEGTIHVNFAEGDGHDTITTTSDLIFHRYSADGTREIGLKDATLTKTGDDTWDLTFKGSRDRITLVHKEPGLFSGTHLPFIDGDTVRWKPDPSFKRPAA